MNANATEEEDENDTDKTLLSQQRTRVYLLGYLGQLPKSTFANQFAVIMTDS